MGHRWATATYPDGVHRPGRVIGMTIPNDPVLSVDDARSHLHAIVAAAGEGREFLVGPRRRPMARIIPAAARNSEPEGPEVTLTGSAATAMLGLAGDSVGFALAESAAAGDGLAVPETARTALQNLGGDSIQLLAVAAWESYRAAGGDPQVTREDIHDALLA